jgi:NADPH2:quinone reductase
MRAVICPAYGPPELLEVREIDDPAPGPGQVLVDVEACSVNFTDLLQIQDLYQFRQTPPFVPGGEVAGVVSAVGDGVTDVGVGDLVIAMGTGGGLAEKTVLNAAAVVVIPPGSDPVAASGLLYAYGTSYYALTRRGQLAPGETLLVLGAGGGVGMAAVELGKVLGARVIAAASSDAKLDACRERGADEVINYATDDLRSRLKELAPGGVDVAYDPVGGALTEPALRSMAWDGRFLVIGFASGTIPSPPLNLALLKSCQIVGVFWGAYVMRDPAANREDLATLLEWWGAGKLRPDVSAVHPLEGAGAAIRSLADRTARGRVVVRPSLVPSGSPG